jgi:hypothetical protein
MEPKFQTSFIPKKPMVVSTGTSVSVIRETNLFSILATAIFIVTIITGGGLFVYKNVLTQQTEEAKKNIASAEEAFQTGQMQDLLDANSRITSSKNLLEKHVAVSKLLTLLQALTVKKLQLNSLIYKNISGSIVLTIKGQAQSYNAIAAQEKVFAENDFIKNPTFSNFIPTDNGYIGVDFTANLMPSLVSYKKAIGSLP